MSKRLTPTLRILLSTFILMRSIQSYADVTQQPDNLWLRFVTVDEPPANFIDATSGKLTGFATEVIESTFNTGRYAAKIEVMPEARAMLTLDSEPNVVMFSISRTADREDKFYWLKQVASKNWILYGNKQGASLQSIHQLNKTDIVATIRGDVREKWMRQFNHFNQIHLVDYHQAIDLLQVNRINYLLYESIGMGSLIKTHGYLTKNFTPVLTVNTSDVYIVMSKKHTGKNLAERVTKTLNSTEAIKRQAEIAKKWQQKLSEQFNIQVAVENDILVY